jgi:hypothetical protein
MLDPTRRVQSVQKPLLWHRVSNKHPRWEEAGMGLAYPPNRPRRKSRGLANRNMIQGEEGVGIAAFPCAPGPAASTSRSRLHRDVGRTGPFLSPWLHHCRFSHRTAVRWIRRIYETGPEFPEATASHVGSPKIPARCRYEMFSGKSGDGQYINGDSIAEQPAPKSDIAKRRRQDVPFYMVTTVGFPVSLPA